MGATLLFAALSLGSVGADWTQAGYDAAGTGAVDTSGPAFNETALVVGLPGYRPQTASPLILEDQVFTLVRDADAAGRQTSGIAVVDLNTADVETLHEMSALPYGMAADATSLYVVTDQGIAAYPREPGEPRWGLPHPVEPGPDDRVACIEPVLRNDRLLVSCYFADPENPTEAQKSRTYVAQVNVITGTYVWTWVPFTDQMGGSGNGQGLVLGSSTSGIQHASIPYALSASDDHVFLTSVDAVSHGGAYQAYMRAIDREDGSLEWSVDSQPAPDDVRAPEPDDRYIVRLGNTTGSVLFQISKPVVAAEGVFVKFHDLQLHDHSSGDEIARADVRTGDRWETDWGTGMAMAPDRVYVSTRETITALHRDDMSLVWSLRQTTGDEFFHAPSLMVAEGMLYAQAADLEFMDADAPNGDEYRSDTVYAYDVSGSQPAQLAWKRTFENRVDYQQSPYFSHPYHWNQAHRVAVSDGVMAVQSIDGVLTILGRTDASIQPLPEVSTIYPDVGQEVTIDLSDTRPGAQASDLSFRVDWGDGATSDWTGDTVFVHRYGGFKDFTARIEARNAAGQTSVEEVVFQVGKEDPREPTLLEKAFDPDNQDKTFFVLGLMVTLGGAIIGVSRIHARRSLLARELEAVEDAFLMTRHIPLECEQALGERKTHARALLLDNKLHESQFGVLDRRIDELRGDVRVNSLEDRFDFMPVGLMKTLQRILADGHITTGEHENFLTALDANKMMTEAQKDKVKKLIDRWFVRDAVAPWADTAN